MDASQLSAATEVEAQEKAAEILKKYLSTGRSLSGLSIESLISAVAVDAAVGRSPTPVMPSFGETVTAAHYAHLQHHHHHHHHHHHMHQQAEQQYLSLSPLKAAAENLNFNQPGSPSTCNSPPPTGPAASPDQDIIKELMVSRSATEQLKIRVHKQQYEIRTLRDRIRLFGEANEREGQDALVVVLTQLAEAEQTIANLRANVDQKESIISALRNSCEEGSDNSYIKELESELAQLQHQNDVLQSRNEVLRDDEAKTVLGPEGQKQITQLQQSNEVLQNKNVAKAKSMKDLEKLLQLHLNLRGAATESKVLTHMSGKYPTSSISMVPASERMM